MSGGGKPAPGRRRDPRRPVRGASARSSDMSNALLVVGRAHGERPPDRGVRTADRVLHAAAAGREGRARARHRCAGGGVRRRRHVRAARPGHRLRVVGDVVGRGQRRPVGAGVVRAAGRARRRSTRWGTCTTASASPSRRTSTRRRRRRRSRGGWSARRTTGRSASAARLTDGTPIAIASKRSTYGGRAGVGARVLSRERPGADGERLRRLPVEHGRRRSTTASTGSTSTTRTSGTSTRASVRSGRTASIRICRPGATGAWDWQGFITLAEQPNALEPGAGVPHVVEQQAGAGVQRERPLVRPGAGASAC